MGFVVIFLLLVFPNLIYSAPIASPSISPNFTASNFQFIDVSGAFLVSLNNLFTASITNSNSYTSLYYFLIIHVQSNSIIWSANPNKPVSTSSLLTLSPTGLSLSDDSGLLVWSTPPLSSPVASMLLLDSGNLLLLDHSNVSLWESFHFPTDTIVVGQRLTVMNPLFPAQPDDHDISVGGSQFRLLLTSSDLLLQWNRITFWKLSMDLKAFTHSSAPVSFLAMNASGFYLFSGNGSTVVTHVNLNLNSGSSSEFFRFGRFGFDGKFKIMSFINGSFVEEFVGPSEICQIPTICGKLKLCSAGTCSCPPSFTGDSLGGCVPADSSISLASSCGNISNMDSNSSFSYLRLINGVDYFANTFMEPATHGVDLQFCKDLCSKNCSCLGLFFEDSSSSCFLIWNQIGSIMSTNKGRVGFIKTLRITPISEGRSRKRIPLVGLILIPSSAFFLVITFAVLLLWFRRWRMSVMLQRSDSSSSAELEMSLILGLPIRYSYNEIATATNNFKTQIGSGGFGIVYKGTLPDKTIVAVKKITSFGVQGKRNFCAEIGVIGNIHHVNLVSLKGFCLQGRQRLLVLEYMNKGSLDEALFGDGDDPILEWKDRFQITLGTARGLAYLHSGCDHKIIHCDVKPENILLNHSSGVKISDFGLSKLLTPEQSGLFTTLRGTRGYLAPEWLTNSTISDKTDVYSFGMVVLEIVRGRKNWLLQEEERVYFPLLALQMHMKGRYLELVDPRLEGKVGSDEAEMLIRVGLCCVHEDPVLRPTMANVVGMLEGGVPMANPIVESLSFLYLYGRRFTEATMVENLTLQDPFALQRALALTTTSTSTRHGHPHNREKKNNEVVSTFSYISSQQVSGPR